jgi:hypothetical protein
MAVWKSVEKIQITITPATEPVTTNLSKGQTVAQCVPWYTMRAGGAKGNIRDLAARVEIIDNGGTAAVKITSTDMTDTDSTIFEVFVVEFDASINVQQVVATIADATSSTNVTVTDVGAQTSAFMIYSGMYGTGTATGWRQGGAVRVRFNGASTTSVTISRGFTTGTVTGVLYVVDCDAGEFVVEHAQISLSASAAETGTATIGATVAADPFLIHSFETDESGGHPLDQCWWADLTNTTTVTVNRNTGDTSNTNTSTHEIAVVECQNSEWDVQRNTALTLATTSQTDTITAIDQTRSFINCGHAQISTSRNSSATNTVNGDLMAAADFSADTTVRFQILDATITNSIVSYEVVQFAPAITNTTILVPTGPWR